MRGGGRAKGEGRGKRVRRGDCGAGGGGAEKQEKTGREEERGFGW